MELKEKTEYFGNLLSVCHNLYLWQFDKDFVLLDSSCDIEKQMMPIMYLENLKDIVTEYRKLHRNPLILTSSFSLMWGITFGTFSSQESKPGETGNEDDFYLLGPFFIDDSSIKALETDLHRRHLSPDLLQRALSFLKEIPIISFSKITEYALMLHYTVTGERISISELHYRDYEQADSQIRTAQEEDPETALHGTYEAEREMLRMVAEGDLNITEHIAKMYTMGNMGKLTGKNSDRQMKNAVLVNIILFSRAAISGGLSPELSMTLTDRYFQAVEDSRSISELTEIAKTMEMDFVRRVHKCRTENGYSSAVQTVCDYIELHLEEKICLETMAKTLGYASYYLSKKFKAETGKKLKEYILECRLERAKFLLKKPELPIHEISERLQFSSPSYFSENFRKYTGMTPKEYREELP
ncbi:MAG: helix-turn-helix domain-containing protein [Lachnospiraceae bacterium]|nr:helix-turn-helix domain-containing protein [Lachnospiraceae bacterium]